MAALRSGFSGCSWGSWRASLSSIPRFRSMPNLEHRSSLGVWQKVHRGPRATAAGSHPTPSADPMASSAAGSPKLDYSRTGIGISASIQAYMGQAQGNPRKRVRVGYDHWSNHQLTGSDHGEGEASGGCTNGDSIPLCIAKACNVYPGCSTLPFHSTPMKYKLHFP